MVHPSSKLLPIALALVFALGLILYISSETLSLHFLAEKGARLEVNVPAERYELLSECLETHSGKGIKAWLQPLDAHHNSVFCAIFVHNGTTKESIATAGQIARGIESDFLAKQIQKPSFTLPAEPVPIISSEVRIATKIGERAGTFLWVGAGILALLHFLTISRRTPPLLPQQVGQRNEAAKFDY